MLLASSAPNAATPTAIYEVPAGKKAILMLDLVNRGAERARVNLAYVNGAGAPADANWVEYEFPLEPKTTRANTLQRTGIILGAGARIWLTTDKATVSAAVTGIVEDV